MAEHLDTPAVKGVGYVLQFFFSLLFLCLGGDVWYLLLGS